MMMRNFFSFTSCSERSYEKLEFSSVLYQLSLQRCRLVTASLIPRSRVSLYSLIMHKWRSLERQ